MTRLTTPRPVNGSVHCIDELGFAVTVGVLHQDQNSIGTMDEIHRPTHSLYHGARNHPVGQVAR